jgi:hypothetical protein
LRLLSPESKRRPGKSDIESALNLKFAYLRISAAIEDSGTGLGRSFDGAGCQTAVPVPLTFIPENSGKYGTPSCVEAWDERDERPK